jgi:hypothetical protein
MCHTTVFVLPAIMKSKSQMVKSFILWLLVIAFSWHLTAETTAKDIKITVDPDLKFFIFKPDSHGTGEMIEQEPGLLSIPQGEQIVIALKKLNKKTFPKYLAAINKNKLHELNASIGTFSPDFLPELGRSCPLLSNITVGILLEDKNIPDFSSLKNLSQLRILIGPGGKRKSIAQPPLILWDITKNEQNYINQTISDIGQIAAINDLYISARYLDIDLSSYRKQQHLKNLSIICGKLTLPDDLGSIEKLSLSCHVLNGYPQQMDSFKNISELSFSIDTATSTLLLPEMANLETLDMSWNFVSEITFGNMPKLKTLKMACCQMLTRLSGLKLRRLMSLDLSHCNGISSLDFLLGMDALEHLNLYGCVNVKDASVLSAFRHLKTLNIAGCDIENYDFLAQLPNLQTLYISYPLDESQLKKIKEKVKPGCEIIQTIFLEMPM